LQKLTGENLFQLNRIGDPQLSPDGSLLVYAEQYIDARTHAWRSNLWLAPADGSAAPRRLTRGGKNHSPRWAPDGRRIAFLSDRSGTTQAWLLDLTGGDAAQLTEGEVEPSGGLVWSPDGSQIAFAAWTSLHERDELPYPGAPALAPDHAPEAKQRPRVITRYDHKHDGIGHYGERFRQLYRAAVGTETAPAPVKPERLLTLEANCDQPSWSPDGARIAFVVSGAEDRHFFEGSDLWLLDVAGGEARLLWQPGGGCSSRPAWSPDGERVALVADDAQVGPYTTTNGLWEVTVANGKAVNLTAAFDREVGDPISSDWRHGGHTGPTWTPAGWLFIARSEGRSHVYQTPGEALTKGAIAVAGYSYAGGRLAYQAGTPDQPDRIYVDGTEIARPGGAWAETSLRPARHFQFKAPDGQALDGWVMLPEGEGPHPGVLAIHGGPHNVYGEAFTLQFQLLAAAGYAVVFINPRGSQSYGQEFAAAVCGDWGGADYHDLMQGLEQAIALGGIDSGRLGVTGWSYGGFMTNRVVTLTARFKAAVSGACISNLHSFYGTSDIGDPFLAKQAPGKPWSEPGDLLGRSPLQEVEKIATPMLLLHGEDDLRCPVTQSEELYQALKRLGKTAVFVRYPGEPHSFGQPLHVYDRHRRTIAWFDHYVKG
jgi:dipeptidyl aminopeptidase/acylaminoacyl peptidase